jgi:signal peptidase I
VKPSSRPEHAYRWLPDGTPVALGDERLPTSTPRTIKKKRALDWLEWALLILGALTVALLIKTFLFQAFYIPSESMSPTLEKNDRVIVNKLSYRLHDVNRGDVIVFKAPEGVDPTVKDLVKRVIGLPGETIEQQGGKIYVDGKRLKEPYLTESAIAEPGPGFARIKIPKDSYWVMGDNRSNSKDSRLFPDHFIHKRDIVGRVFVRVWPLNRLDIL